MTGWIKLWRYLFTKPIWINSTPEQKTILITLMGMVNYESNQWEWEGRKFDLVPGQVITSIAKIQQRAGKGISQQNVRSSIARFGKLEFLTNESTNAGRLITINNWDIYQGDDPNINKVINKWTTSRTQAEHKPLTSDLTPIKEKNKNIKKKDKEKNIQLSVVLRDNSYFHLREEKIASYQLTYPNINVRSEILKIIQWNEDNPTKRKTRAGLPRHINAWLSGAQGKTKNIEAAPKPREHKSDNLTDEQRRANMAKTKEIVGDWTRKRDINKIIGDKK